MFSKNLQSHNLMYKAVSVAATGKEFCSCVNKVQQCCLLFLYNNILSVEIS